MPTRVMAIHHKTWDYWPFNIALNLNFLLITAFKRILSIWTNEDVLLYLFISDLYDLPSYGFSQFLFLLIFAKFLYENSLLIINIVFYVCVVIRFILNASHWATQWCYWKESSKETYWAMSRISNETISKFLCRISRW